MVETLSCRMIPYKQSDLTNLKPVKFHQSLNSRKKEADRWFDLSLVVRKPDFGVSDQVQHKPGCTAIEDG